MSTLTHVLEREKNVGKMSTFKRLVWKIKKISLPSTYFFQEMTQLFYDTELLQKNRNWQHSSQNCHDFWAMRNLFLNFKNVNNRWTCTINDELWKLYYTSEKEKNLFIKLLGGHIYCGNLWSVYYGFIFYHRMDAPIKQIYQFKLGITSCILHYYFS